MDETYIAQRQSSKMDEGKKYMSTRTQYCAWERVILQWKQLNNGNAEVATFRSESSFSELLGLDDRISLRCRFFTKSKAIRSEDTMNGKSSVIGSFLSLCSTTWTSTRWETRHLVH